MRPGHITDRSDAREKGAGPLDAAVTPAAVSDEVLETSRLVLELLHAGYALEQPARAALAATPTAHAERARVSRQAIRAAIELYQRGELTMGALAAALQMSPGWATRVVEELVVAGYAIRTVDPRDRRSVRIRLSPAAVDEAGAAYRWRAEVIDQSLAGMGPEERSAVRTFLSRVVDRLVEGERP